MTERSRFLVLVSRREPALYDHLARALAGTGGVEVLLDRRQGERRKGGAQPDDRRRADRRLHPGHRFPALGSEVVRAGAERVKNERASDERARGDRAAGAPVPAGEEPHAYRTLLWPTVRLADFFRARPGRET